MQGITYGTPLKIRTINSVGERHTAWSDECEILRVSLWYLMVMSLGRTFTDAGKSTMVALSSLIQQPARFNFWTFLRARASGAGTSGARLTLDIRRRYSVGLDSGDAISVA